MKVSDIIGKTVNECIGICGFNVKLGAEDGSAFVFCGILKDMDADRLDNVICNMYESAAKSAAMSFENLSKKLVPYKVHVENMRAKKKNRIERLEKDKNRSLTPEEIKELSVEFSETKESYNEYIKSIKKRMNTLNKNKESVESKLKAYTTIRDRKITDCYESIDEEGTVILLFEGSERGCAWTTEEYREGQFGSFS